MANEVTVIYEGSMRAEARIPQSDSGVTIGASTCCGTSGTDFTPLDYLATAYASCVVMSMDLIAQKNGFDIAGAEVGVSLKTSTRGNPGVRGIEVTVRLPRPYTDEQITLLRKGEGYCPVHNAIHPDVETTLKFEMP